jgi:hypothetical protein
MTIEIDREMLLVVIILEVLISAFGGIAKGIMDSIAHHDSFKAKVPKKFELYFSRESYWNSKYEFKKKHVWWTKESTFKLQFWKGKYINIGLTSNLKGWFVDNIIIMGLDAWHTFAFLDTIFDTLAWTIPLYLATGIFWMPFILCYFAFQLGFRKTYK